MLDVAMTRRKRTVATGDGFVVVDVMCREPHSNWSPSEPAKGFGLVFVRQGGFYRRTERSERAMDATSCYFELPEQEQRFAHRWSHGDACTAIEMSEELGRALADDDLARISEPRFTPIDVSVAVQLLTRQARRPDQFELTEIVARLVTMALTGSDRLAHLRSSTHAIRRRLVDEATQILRSEPRITLVGLAGRLAISPPHLSRVFRAETGRTLSAYRNELRVREAVDRLGEGERSLTRLAHDLGFADQAHMTRTVRRETRAAPSTLRRLFATAR
jgi:AraC-like DNA-binding protein